MRHAVAVPVLAFALVAVAAAAEPEKVLVAKPDAFPTLVNPMCSHCRDEAKRRADLKADDRVLCWLRGYSDGGAIPLRFFLNDYRVISDTYGVFVHDPDAGFARAFAPSLDFTFHGWRNGVMVMKHKDGTLYSCLTGVAFDGPKKGEQLKPVPTLVSDWGPWAERYPQNVAFHMFDKYQPVELPAKENADSVKSRGPLDKRLPADARVLGVVAGKDARAYPLDTVEKDGLLTDKLGDTDLVILWQADTKTAAAYRPLASPPPKTGPKPRAVTLARDDKNPAAPFTDKETGSRWDVAGRAVEGEFKGWTLEWADGTMVKWFAWAAEVPHTTVHGKPKDKDKDPGDAIKEIAGTAEFLRMVPKKFGVLKTVTPAKGDRGYIEFLPDGETDPKGWLLDAEAEVKRDGTWGRLDQFKEGERVWVWFKTDRKKEPTAVFMLCDDATAQDIHLAEWTVTAVMDGGTTVKPKKGDARTIQGTPTAKVGDKVYVVGAKDKPVLVNVADFEAKRKQQQAWLRQEWADKGLPGTLSYVHYHGEAELHLDHEAMRWGRSLQPGDKVNLAATPPIKAVVKSVSPLRERTAVRLVVNGLDLGELKVGQRVRLQMPAPAAEVDGAAYPPDIDAKRTRAERVEWFFASTYCTCGVGRDTCTGHFYTLAACNPNGCGMPNLMRETIGAKIDKGLTDRQIWDDLLKERGPALLKPHLLP